MNIDNFEHLSDLEVDYMADKVRAVFTDLQNDLHDLRMTYFDTNWFDRQEERAEVAGRIDFMDGAVGFLHNYGGYPITVEGMVGAYEEFEEDLRMLSTRISGFHPSTWTFWRGYQKAGVSMLTSLEEAMEVEGADPNGYED